MNLVLSCTNLIYQLLPEVQLPAIVKFWRILVGGLLGLGSAACWLGTSDGLGSPGIVISAHLAVLAWAWASWEGLSRSRTFPVVWAWGLALMVNHVAVAFHFGHGWSHQNALEQTRLSAGVAEGLYVNYLFVLIWLQDVLWALVAPSRYANRSRWIGWGLHGFFAFMMFNATIVYGRWPAQLLGASVFAWLGYGLFRRKPLQTPS